ncbi:MAG: sulfurtransferase [Promethearchaeota archaeon Loki_b32]|nr:MAG: sulfurtransferase [Candidatus Lokiarchaeota archaeon Loki_b32]
MVDYDVIIIGAGSVGVPTALATANDELKTLVIDSLPSVAQADNKHAIGGIRATHSHKGKIWLCQRSIEIFSIWEERFGDDIWWEQGGYTFLAYNNEHENLLKETVELQKNYGLNIDYVDVEKIKELIPGINEDGLLGATYSPEDGNASPLLSLHSFFRQSKNLGAEYHFNEKVIDILTKNNKITGIKTTKGQYNTKNIINAAGAHARDIGNMVGLDIPVEPESHEAGITEPVKNFFTPMIVDIRPCSDPKFGDSKNYYFYQNKEGKIIFCLTPNPNILGTDRRETSSFLPQISKRMIQLLPRLRNIKIRRTWRGLYPMTPDGNPIIGTVNEIQGYINAVGMCGQGFMLGPGLGELLSRLLTEKMSFRDKEILDTLSFTRNFGVEEELK